MQRNLSQYSPKNSLEGESRTQATGQTTNLSNNSVDLSDTRLPLRAVGGLSGQFLLIDIVERDGMAKRCRVGNELAGRFWGQHLPPLIKGHISLGAAKTLSQLTLGDPKSLTDGFNVVHLQIVALLLF
jgi:hypothetical protein